MFTNAKLRDYFKLFLIYRNNEDAGFTEQSILRERNSLYDWPNETILHYSVPSLRMRGTFKNTPARHAEILLLDALEEEFERRESEDESDSEDDGPEIIQIRVTQNYSPCEECADEIIDFIRDRRYKIRMSISFGTFYYFDFNKRGLVRLRKAGVNLQLIDQELRNKIEDTVFSELYKYHVSSNKMQDWLVTRNDMDKEYMEEIES
ncbi:hypothetical protein CHS0354_036302 [Potamilus streckersoni]|uniref:Cytidine deaminase n=1 Tax=Potamilus streckersoni TaxID=2493646 RepID=A0AAE0T7Y2_9BIVA|nr:hypothetical protein CHS0354_036302 [Potamilus streckersoni]